MKSATQLMRIAILASLLASATAYAEWYPIKVSADGKPQSYTPIKKASQPWRICALLPQGKDRFWWGVSWGLAQEAERQGVKIGIYQAGGYEQAAVQKAQFDQCLAQKANAIIIAVIDASALASSIAQAAQRNVPVIDLINGLNNPQISAHVCSDFTQLGQLAAQHILALANGRSISIGWLPGPAKSEWVQHAEQGVLAALAGSKVKLIHGGYGATDPNTQMTLVRALFAQHTPDYILANAVAADAASRYLARANKPLTPIVSFYSNQETLAALGQRQLAAVASTAPVIEARISVDLAVRILDKQPYARVVNPPLTLLTAQNLSQFDRNQMSAPEQQWFISRPLPR